MNRWSPLLAGLLCFAPIAQGESVYKCILAAGVAYHGSPCDVGVPENAPATTATTTAATSAATTSRNADTPRCNERPMQTAKSRWRPRSLCIGITDDEVLNLAGWGRPSNIVRVRSGRSWQEQWTYVSRAAGSRRLEFVNGNLASVGTPMADEHESMRVPVGTLARTD